jgi:hypothetical protein
MAKRTTPPAPPETEAKTRRRRAATAAVTKTTKAREAIAAPKSALSKPPRAESRGRTQTGEAASRPAARRSRVAEPMPQAPPEPHRAPAAARAGDDTPAHPSARYADERIDEPLDSPLDEAGADEIDPELRHRMISEAAYHHYIERGYEDGYDLDDWLQAEAEIDRMLLSRGP